MANLFTSQTPSSTDNSDGTPGITTATTVKFAQAGQVAGIRFYATTTVSGTYTVALYRVDSADPGTGTLLASKVAGSAPTGGAWNTIAFDSSVSVVSTELYRACVHSNAGRYVATSNFFTSGGGGLTNGDITAPANLDNPIGLGALSQGTFEINASLTYPNDTFNAACYFVDVDFAASGSTVNGTATVAGAGSVTAAVRQQAGSAVTGTGSTSAVSAQRSGATIAGTGSVSAAVVQRAGAAVTGAGSVAANTSGATSGTATVTGAGSVSALVRQGPTASRAGVGSVSATGIVIVPGSATVTGTGSVSALVRQGATAAAVGAGQVSASSAGQVIAGTATVLGVGSVIAVSGSRITPRPNSGTTARPDMGTTARP